MPGILLPDLQAPSDRVDRPVSFRAPTGAGPVVSVHLTHSAFVLRVLPAQQRGPEGVADEEAAAGEAEVGGGALEQALVEEAG